MQVAKGICKPFQQGDTRVRGKKRKEKDASALAYAMNTYKAFSPSYLLNNVQRKYSIGQHHTMTLNIGEWNETEMTRNLIT